MFVKVYKYHIQNDKMDEYLSIQERASEIYGKFIDFQTTISKEVEIHELFKAFQYLLLSVSEISEEDFIVRKT